MNLSVYDTLSKSMVAFRPQDDTRVRWYVCGPTVYDAAHLGHARAYVTFDLIRRVLERVFGHEVTYIMNITDIDDKIIQRARETNASVEDHARLYERLFFEDMDALGVRRPTEIVRVSESISKIVDYIDKIRQNGMAYESGGSVYFDIAEYLKRGFKYPKFVSMPETENDEKYDKRHSHDFALWKAAKPNEPAYREGSYYGRPGWHIECSAMATSKLGSTFDIHSGGIDLRFPHHDNEIAQAEAHNNQPGWAKYWLHVGHLHIDGLKMSKSLKNFMTIRDILKHTTASELRLWFMQSSWTDSLTYSEESLNLARADYKRFKEFLASVPIRTGPSIDAKLDDFFLRSQTMVELAFANNFDFPTVRRVLLELVREANKSEPNRSLQAIGDFVRHVLDTVGVCFVQQKQTGELANVLAAFRSEVRTIALKLPKTLMERNEFLKVCDKVRLDAMQLGLKIEDTVLKFT